MFVNGYTLDSHKADALFGKSDSEDPYNLEYLVDLTVEFIPRETDKPMRLAYDTKLLSVMKKK